MFPLFPSAFPAGFRQFAGFPPDFCRISAGFPLGFCAIRRTKCHFLLLACHWHRATDAKVSRESCTTLYTKWTHVVQFLVFYFLYNSHERWTILLEWLYICLLNRVTETREMTLLASCGKCLYQLLVGNAFNSFFWEIPSLAPCGKFLHEHLAGMSLSASCGKAFISFLWEMPLLASCKRCLY